MNRKRSLGTLKGRINLHLRPAFGGQGLGAIATAAVRVYSAARSPLCHRARTRVLARVLPCGVPSVAVASEGQSRLPPLPPAISRSCVGQRHLDGVLGHEPHLQLVAPDYIADDQVVGAVVATLGRAPCHRARLLQDDFVGVQQP
jgi:hypothetical protein